MPLCIELRPHEKIFINGAVIANGDSRAQMTILNDVPVLREKDILTEARADSPCKRLYLSVQLMYMDTDNRARYRPAFDAMAAEVGEAAPSTRGQIAAIAAEIEAGRLYQALKLAKRLIDYEQELIHHAQHRP